MYAFGPNDTIMANYDRFDLSKGECFLNNLIRAPVRGCQLYCHICTCAYQGVRNVNFSKKFAYVLNG